VRALVALSLVAALGFVGYRTIETRGDERRLTRIAGEIAHRDVTVRCQSVVGELIDVDGEYGRVNFDGEGRPGNKAKLDRPICTALSRLLRGKSVGLESGSLAVEALAHESYHLAGVQSEAAAQCYALQAMRFVAARLEVSPEVAQAYVETALVRYPTLPEEYRSEECREGGGLDLNRETGVWP
jgi:hypothetical protein